MFAYAAIPDFSCVVYETETEIETAVFPPKTDRNRTDLEKSRTVTTLQKWHGKLSLFQNTFKSRTEFTVPAIQVPWPLNRANIDNEGHLQTQ